MLHHSSIPKTAYLCSLAIHMVNAANMGIPAKWHYPEPPSVADWLKRIQKNAEMEDLTHQAKDTPSKFGKIWFCGLHFVTTDNYKQFMT